MSLLLLAASALFAALLLLNNLYKAFARREKVGLLDTLLAYLVTLVAVAALIVNALEATPDATLPTYALVFAGIVLASSLLVILIEAFRPQRLRGSRGLLSGAGGILIGLASVGVPFVGAYFSLLEPAPAGTIAQAATARATATDVELEITNEVEMTETPSEASERVNTLFVAIREILADEIDADEVAVFTQLDAGVPLAQIVEENGGNVEQVISRLTAIMQTALRESVDAGEMNPLQGALFISQMETFVRIAVNSDLNAFESRFGEGDATTGTPAATRRSLLALLTPSPFAADANTPAAPTASVAPTSVSIPTATAEAIASQTPTPRPIEASPIPTSTPLPTRERYATRTALPTATGVTPCIASVNYNLRLRAAPDTDAETLLVIPFGTSIMLYARSADSAWWQTDYEGQTGWVDGQYLSLSAACSSLPST